MTVRGDRRGAGWQAAGAGCWRVRGRMRAEQIRDRKSLQAWLRDQPREVAVMIAARAALRVVPAWLELFQKDGVTDRPSEFPSVWFRCALTAFVAVGRATRVVLSAADMAASVAYAYAGTAAADASASAVAGASVAYAADAAANGRSGDVADAVEYAAEAAAEAANYPADASLYAAVIWDETRADAVAVEQVAEAKRVLSASLWSADTPEDLAKKWHEFRRALLADHADWSFWIDWYERVLRGRPQNWEMLTEIVLIPDADWRQGPRHVNAIIAGIVEKHRGGVAGKRVEDLPPPAAARLQAQVAFLLQTSACAEVTAAGLSAQIAHAITVYKHEQQCNQLPEALLVFEHMAETLHRLSRSVAKATDDPDEVSALKQQILDLEAQIETLTGKLRAAEYRDDFARFWDAGVESAGKWAGPAAMGGVVYFVGNYVDPGMVNQLGVELARWAQAVRGARG